MGERTLITAASLKSQKSKELAQLAKKNGVPGWHAMKKEQLIKTLLKIARQKERSKNARNLPDRPRKPEKISRLNGAASESAIAKKIRVEREQQENLKNLASAASIKNQRQPPTVDRVILVVRDSFWIQAYWEITRATVQRAKIALTGSWHHAKPVLRLFEITSDGNTNSVEDFVEEIEIHSGVNNWYISNQSPGKTLRVAIGYAAPGNKFHLIAKSNQVTPPPANCSDVDENWTDITNDVEKYYALSGGFDENSVSAQLQSVFEEKSRQPMHAPAFERLGSGVGMNGKGLEFSVDAHLVVHGSTDPRASITIAGEPVRLQTDGSFSVRLNLPNRRQVLPVVAASRDGTQQKTTILAIERNTKTMEPVEHEVR